MLSSFKKNLCLEFDFGQNLALPNLPVSAQFYLRLIWLHVFNVHVHSSKREISTSYMFFFMEGFYKKGGNTVFNFILHVIVEEFKKKYYDRIFLFLDSCGGQNKNYNMMILLSLIFQKLEVPIEHLYPVRGHSYSQCDRNFGTYGQKKKMTESIQTENENIDLIKSARNPPFIILQQKDYTVKNFENKIKDKYKLPKDLQISKAVKRDYFSSGSVNIYDSFANKPVTYFIEKQ